MSEKWMRFRLGVLVLASISLFAWLVMLFARPSGIFSGPSAEYYIVFDYAPGVVIGTPVRRSGVRIGKVGDVNLDSASGKVRVTILVEKPNLLFEDDQPVLVKGLLGGDVSIDFQRAGAPPADAELEPKRPEPPPPIQPIAFQPAQPPAAPQPPPQRVPAKPGTTFEGTTQADIAGAVRRLDQLTPVMEETLRAFRDFAKTSREAIPQFQRTSDEIRLTVMTWGRLGERFDVLVQTNQDKIVKALDNLSDVLGQAARIFSEENQRNLTALLRNVREGTDNLGSLTKNTDEMIRRLTKSIEQADQVLANVQQATKPLAERSERITRNLDESMEKLNATLTDARELLRAIGRSDGAFQRFVSDPTLYQNLSDAALMITRLMPRVERILRDVEVFADKIARHPESLGIGGAISPSSGLKEAPSTSPIRRPPGP